MKKLIFLVTLVICANVSMAQTKVGDVTLPNEVTLSDAEMTLNGAGMREKLWFDLYVGGLYVTTKSKSADALINSDEPMAIKLHITDSKVTQEKMIGAVNEGFEKSSHGKATKDQITKFKGFFNEKIAEGTILDIVYVGGKTTVYRNGKEKGSVAGLDFKKALYAIWLGKEPADEDLKEGMLGK